MANDEAASPGGNEPRSGDARLDAPAFHRNGPVITAHLCALLGPARGDVLELGSGTGQHVAAFAAALPRLTWWPTDADPRRLPGIDAWRRHSGHANLRPAARLNAALTPWQPLPGHIPLADGLAAVIAINIVHIAPWEVAEGIFRGAGRHLAEGGHLVFYGPFIRDDVPTAPSNAAFDAQLRAENPAWGLRELGALITCAGDEGLAFKRATEVPANNLILEFSKPA